MPRRIFQCLVLACLSSGSLLAAADPFVGKWKLDTARSHLTDQMRVESAGANAYRFSFDGTSVETIVADGSEQPGLTGTKLSVTVEDAHTWKVVRKKDGQMLLTATWTLSPDGRTLRDAFTQFQPDGGASTAPLEYQRTAGTSGFPGTWERDATFDSPIEIEVRPFGKAGLSFSTPSQGSTRNVEFDGKELANPGVAPGVTTAGRRVNKRTVHLTDKMNGKPADTRDISVSESGKTLTIAIRLPGRASPVVLIFDRA